MEQLENHVDFNELENPLAIMRKGGVGGIVSGNWEDLFSNTASYLNDEKIKFAYVTDGDIAEISVNGKKDYNKARAILYKRDVKGVLPGQI